MGLDAVDYEWMFFLIYVSSAKDPMTNTQLDALLVKARANNQQLGITGLLLYRDDCFMQLLEGDEKEVMALHRKIGRDPRHNGVLLLHKGHYEGRSFPDWNMGFRRISQSEAPKGYSDYLKKEAFDNMEPKLALRLLQSFRDSNVA